MYATFLTFATVLVASNAATTTTVPVATATKVAATTTVVAAHTETTHDDHSDHTHTEVAAVPKATVAPTPTAAAPVAFTIPTADYKVNSTFSVDPAPTTALEVSALQSHITSIIYGAPAVPAPFAPVEPVPFAPLEPMAPVPIDLTAFTKFEVVVLANDKTVRVFMTDGDQTSTYESNLADAVNGGNLEDAFGKKYTSSAYAVVDDRSDSGSGSVLVVIIILILIIIIAAVAGALYYFLVHQKKNKKTVPADTYDNGAGSA